MIYLVSKQQRINSLYTIINETQALELLQDWEVAQADSETTGLNPHIDKLICFQLGNHKRDVQIVIDCNTIDITKFKEFLEKTPLIFHNAKFDLQFLYTQGIIPRIIYDTMIAEQILYLGWPYLKMSPSEYIDNHYSWPYLEEIDLYGNTVYRFSYSLKALCQEYLAKNMDKTIRDTLSTRGLDEGTILYAASDVMYLETIKDYQKQRAQQEGNWKAIGLECNFIPALAYMEWCGVKLDETKWKAKMVKDQQNLEQSIKALNNFLVRRNLTQYYHYDLQGDLFTGFSSDPISNINWSSSKQVIPLVKLLGFDTSVKDKITGEDKDSVLEKSLQAQKGIDDEFLQLYFNYQGYNKVVSSFGQSHLDAINPVTGRLHTSFKQLGASSGRLSCGGGVDNSLAAYKHLPSGTCKLLNLQQLPHNAETRACFVAEPGHKWVSCDFGAEEARLTADVSKDKEYYKEFTERTGDTHAMFAWACYEKECRALGCTSAMDVKQKAKKWRDAVKSAEFAYTFSASADTIAKTANIPVKQAEQMVETLDNFFSGLTEFKKSAAAAVKKDGYILICPETGHKLYWWDHDKWLKEGKTYTSEFWDNYKLYHKGTGDEIALNVRRHFQAADKYSKLGLNSRTQGRGAIIFKDSGTKIFNWIIDHGYFNKIKLCVGVHDEWNIEYPEELIEFPTILQDIMEKSAAKYCKSLPIPASPLIDTCWRH